MTDFEKKLKNRTKKIMDKIKKLSDRLDVANGDANKLVKKFEEFAEEQQTEKAQKIKEILGK